MNSSQGPQRERWAKEQWRAASLGGDLMPKAQAKDGAQNFDGVGEGRSQSFLGKALSESHGRLSYPLSHKVLGVCERAVNLEA